ncbi:MAG: 2-oxo-tetronate isomerase [Burkholderiales bacterium]
MPRFAANLSFLFNEVPFLDRFAEAAHAGFRAVEFTFPYEFQARDIAERAQSRNLDVVLFNAPPGDFAAGDRGLASVPGREHDFHASIATAFRYAQLIGCKRLHVMSGVAPIEADRDELERRRRLLIRQLKEVCADAAAQGITILIEPINPRDMPGYFLRTQAQAHAIREEVGAPNLKIQFDLYHAQIVEGDLTEKLRKYIAHVGHVQIAGVPGRNEPDTGEVNYAHLFRVLDELRYDGWIGCEYRPASGTESGLAWLYKLLDRKPL